MKNVVVTINLPQGLKLKNGAFLEADLEVEVISLLDPFYASVKQIQLEGGPYMAKLSPKTLAAAIYQQSKEADQKNDAPPKVSTPEGKRFYAARNNWVINATCYNMLVNISGLVGYTGGHVLGNFSVTKQKGEQGTGVSAKIKDLADGMKQYQVVMESGGRVIPGGHAPAVMAAKGLYDAERAPGRTWVVTGMGANTTTWEVPSPTGGRGKTMKMYASPIISLKYSLTRGYSTPAHKPADSTNFFLCR
jgi:hypothetical protein